MNLTRRLLMTGALISGGAYSYSRGLRYPPLWLEPQAKLNRIENSGLGLQFDGAIHIANANEIRLRAITPEPLLTITAPKGDYQFSVSNLSEQAQIQIEGAAGVAIEESTQGLQRDVTLKLGSSSTFTIRWLLPETEDFTFAVIGDTGGGDELKWCLKRAADLGALFLLHLGDFNYGSDEYQHAINAFEASPVPTYVTIGNHDFHDDGIIYDRFRDEIGPMNVAFELGNVQFINLDTAADFFPASSGLRGDLVDRLKQHTSKEITERIAFTHRPLRDPRPGQQHIVGGVGEAVWLKQQLTELGVSALLTGHVHHSAELDVGGIKQWTVGEGLGHEDIVLQRPVAKMLIGHVAGGIKASFKWVNLEMPLLLHTSHTHEKKLIRAKRSKQLDWYKAQLS